MKRLKFLLPMLAIVICLGIILAVSFHSVQEIHYLKSFYPGSFSVEEARQATLVELIKVLLISLPLVMVVAVCLSLLRLFRKDDP